MRLEANNLHYRYQQGDWVVKNANIAIESGEVIGILGPSGQGKSTLAKILAGYIKPHQGTISIDGIPVSGKGYNPVQLIFQHPEKAVNPRWKMGEVIKEGWNPSAEVMDALGIREEWLTRYPNELSGGELQRFCVARALGPDTRFLLCDEISTMLDAITQADIWNFLLEYSKKFEIGILMITHSRSLAECVCTAIRSYEEIQK